MKGPNRERVNKKHNAIRHEFRKLSAANEYKYVKILAILADKFYLQPETIEKIICAKDEKPVNDLTLF